MGLFRQVISVKPNQIGYLYQDNRLIKRLTPGVYKYFNLAGQFEAVIIPTISKLITVSNQEVLTKDNISLRLSYILEYQITDGDTFINRFNVLETESKYRYHTLTSEAEQITHQLSQVHLRSAIAQVESQALNERKSEILETIPDALQNELQSYGITIHRLLIKDIYFPKLIQQLFAQQLEAKIRAELDLTNARTAVATTRAFKNAANLMKDNENIKFLQYLETISKIAAQGKHTFVLGNLLEQIDS